MKLHAEAPTALNTVTAYGRGFIEINRVRHASSVLLTPERVEPLALERFEQLSERELARLRDLAPEVALLGTGEAQRFPQPKLARPLAEAGIGLEVMATAAACRTYNILLAESRRVAALLIVEKAQ